MKATGLRITLWTVCLLAALLASCGPGSAPAAPRSTSVLDGSNPTSTRLAAAAASATAPSAGDQPAPTPAATSRGSQLVASDPAAVVLGGGRLALVEFFRFT